MKLAKLLIAMIVVAAGGVAAQGTQPVPVERAQKARTVKEAISLLGAQGAEPGRKVLLSAPDIVDGGKGVKVSITSKLPGTDWVGLLVDRSPVPLQGNKDLLPGAEQTVDMKIDLSQTSRVTALVRASGKFYQVSREIKVAFEVPKTEQRF